MKPNDVFQPLAGPVLAALGPVYAVGGAVRAALREESLEGREVDLTTPRPIHDVAKALADIPLPVDARGARWLSLSFTWQGRAYDITQFRAESYPPGSRYPVVTPVPSLEEDALRRDFTINAIYLSPDGTLADPCHGLADLRAGLVRFIGVPQTRVQEDPLRALRCVRFCAQYGAGGLTPDVLAVLDANLPRIRALPAHRVRAEHSRAQKGPFVTDVQTILAPTAFGHWWNGLLQ